MPRAGLTTEAVVDIAARLADDHGRDGLTLAGVVAVAGVRTPSLYAHERSGLYAAAQRAPDGGDEPGIAARTEAVDVLRALLVGYDLRAGDAIQAIRVVRCALHGFAGLEAARGFGMAESVDECFELMLDMLDAGLRAMTAQRHVAA